MHQAAIEISEFGLDDLTLDDACQCWPSLDERVVEQYRLLMAEGVRFPPVKVVQDEDGSLYLWDGFKRYHAAKANGHAVIACEVTEGDRRHAIFLSTSANADHGQQRSPEVVRRAIYTLLDDPEWRCLPLRTIAEHVGVSHTTVARWQQRYMEEHGLVSAPKPKQTRRGEANRQQPEANPTPRDEPEPSDRCIPDDLGEEDDEWQESGEVETPEAKAEREWNEALARCATVLDQLAPEARELFENELAFALEMESLKKLALDKYRQWGGRKRTGPYSARVAWLAECPAMEDALACLDCGGSGKQGSERCPSCRGAGFHLKG